MRNGDEVCDVKISAINSAAQGIFDYNVICWLLCLFGHARGYIQRGKKIWYCARVCMSGVADHLGGVGKVPQVMRQIR